MQTSTELKKLITGHYLYAGARLTIAILIPAIVLFYFGLLGKYYVFPLGVAFMGSIDQPGPMVRRRNTLFVAFILYFLVAFITGLSAPYPTLILIELIVFGLFFSLIGIYGSRLSSVGALCLIIFAIYLNGHLVHHGAAISAITLALGGAWYILVFLISDRVQPYHLARQMLGEYIMELGHYLQVRAQFYHKDSEVEKVMDELLPIQISIKNKQENLREVLFQTRRIVRESTGTGRLLMVLFLDSVDLYEYFITSLHDYEKIKTHYDGLPIMNDVETSILAMSGQLMEIGLAVQAGQAPTTMNDVKTKVDQVRKACESIRQEKDDPNLFMMEQVSFTIHDVFNKIYKMERAASYDLQWVGSLSAGLDLEKFVPNQESFNLKVLLANLTLESQHFRHALRLTLALLLGYLIPILVYFPAGHTYWILIAIIAILKPAYSITKSRNRLRLGGTFLGGGAAFLLLYFIDNEIVLFSVFFLSLLLTYTFLSSRYFIAVFFMTIYLFITFHFVGYGDTNALIMDRLVDTLIGGVIAWVSAYLILPVWGHTQTRTLISKYLKANKLYFESVLSFLNKDDTTEPHSFKLNRRNALVELANLSDNFQKILSDPKEKQKNTEYIHSIVSTANTLSAYIASLSVYSRNGRDYSSLDISYWKNMILAQFDAALTELEMNDVPNESISKHPENISKSMEKQDSMLKMDGDFINILELFDLISSILKKQLRLVRKLNENL